MQIQSDTIVSCYSPYLLLLALRDLSFCHHTIKFSCSVFMSLTHPESVYACNFAICTNKYRLQGPDTKALRNTTECKVYNASNKDYLSKAGWSA